MSDWFDPQTWMRQLPDPLNMRGLLQDSTKAWLNQWATLGRNRPVEVRHGARRWRGTIRSITMYPPANVAMSPMDTGMDALDRAVVVVDEVQVDGLVVGHVEVAANDVRFETLPAPSLQAGPVVVEAVVPLATAAAWVEDAGIKLAGPGEEPGELLVKYRWWRLPFTASVAPAVTARAAVFAIRKLWLGQRQLPLPKTFDLSLSVPLPVPDGMRLRDASLVDADTVAIELQIHRVNYPISAQQILDQLAAGGTRSVIDVDGPAKRPRSRR